MDEEKPRLAALDGARQMHDLCTLASLLLVLAIVWRLGLWRQNYANSPPRRRPLLGNTSGIIIGLGVGVLLAQIPNLFYLSGESVGTLSASKFQKEPLFVSPSDTFGKTGNGSMFSRGTEELPAGIVVPTTDLYLRRLIGKPEEDLQSQPKYLLVLTAAYRSPMTVDSIVSKFRSKDWSIMLFHEDGKTDDWFEYPWANDVVHVSAQQQSKWWFAKRFLHPDIVAAFDYLFLWNSDIDVTNFDPAAYISLVEKYRLEISQPAVEPEEGAVITWEMTKRLEGVDIHRETEERPGWCEDKRQPPCAGFVEISVPVFSRKAWRCVWHLIQNDLVHGWGLDFNVGLCAQGPAHERIGVVDAQYIRILKPAPTNPDPEELKQEKDLADNILERSKYEWEVFKARMAKAEEARREQVRKIGPQVILT